MFIWYRKHTENHVYRQDLLFKQSGDQAEMAGSEVRPTLVDGISGRVTGEEGIMDKVWSVFREAILRRPHRNHMDNFHIPVGLFIGNHGLNQGFRRAAGVPNNYAVTGLDMFYRFLGSGKFLFIYFLPLHK
jgi:hypothetical protein